MKTNIVDLIAANPSCLLEMKESITLAEYRDGFGFKLKNAFEIFKSKRINHSNKDWFAFPSKTLETLFNVQTESEGNLLVIYIIETIKEGSVYCNVVLSNEAFKEILRDKDQHILQVHQMYKKFFKDHIALNMVTH